MTKLVVRGKEEALADMGSVWWMLLLGGGSFTSFLTSCLRDIRPTHYLKRCGERRLPRHSAMSLIPLSWPPLPVKRRRSRGPAGNDSAITGTFNFFQGGKWHFFFFALSSFSSVAFFGGFTPQGGRRETWNEEDDKSWGRRGVVLVLMQRQQLL